MLQTTHAAATFASVLQHSFAYLHCWDIMKDEPKWQHPKARAVGKSAGAFERKKRKSAGGDGFGQKTINLGTAPPEGTTRETKAKKKQEMDGDDDQAEEEEEEERTKLVRVEHAYIDAVQARYDPEQEPSLPNMPEELFQFVPDHLRDRLPPWRRAAMRTRASFISTTLRLSAPALGGRASSPEFGRPCIPHCEPCLGTQLL